MAGRQQTLLDDNLCFTFTAKMEFSFVRFRVWFIQSQSMPPPNLPACHLCGRQWHQLVGHPSQDMQGEVGTGAQQAGTRAERGHSNWSKVNVV